MPILRLSMVLPLACFLHVVDAGCDGPDCARADSAETLLAMKAQFKVEQEKLSEESARSDVLPKLATYTKSTGLANLLALQDTVERVLDDPAKTAVTEDENKTGLERTYDPKDTEVSAEQTIRDYLANVIEATKEAHKVSQETINTYAEQVRTENTDGRVALDKVEELRKTRDDYSKTHSQCRTEEAKLHGTKTTHCTNYDDAIGKTLEAGFDTIVKLWPTVKTHTVAQKDELKSAIIAVSEFLTETEGLPRDPLNETKSRVIVKEKSLIVSAKACDDTEEELKTKRSVCNSDQGRFEVADCMWHDENAKECPLYNERYESALAKYERQQNIQTNAVETRKSEHIAAKRVGCYINVLLATQVNKSEMIKACKNAVHSVDHLDIEFPTVPSKYSCTVRDNTESARTCGDAWLKAEYTEQTWYSSGAVTEACTACPTPAPTPAATVEQACDAETDITVNYDGYTYRTITGLGKASTSTGCDDTFTELPEGFSLAPFDSDVLTNVVRPHPWGTFGAVFYDKPGYYGTAKHGPASDAHDTERYHVRIYNGRYKVGACSMAVFIRKPCGSTATQPQKDLERCYDDKSTKAYGGYMYRTVTGLERDNRGVGCDNVYTALPAGYELAPFSDDLFTNVVKPDAWQTHGIIFLDKPGYYGTAAYPHNNLNTDSYQIMIHGGKYKVSGCAIGVMIRKQCQAVSTITTWIDSTSPGTSAGTGSDARAITLVSGSVGGAYINRGNAMNGVILEKSADGHVPSASSKRWIACVKDPNDNNYPKMVELNVHVVAGTLYMQAVSGRILRSDVSCSVVQSTSGYDSLEAVPVVMSAAGHGYGVANVGYTIQASQWAVLHTGRYCKNNIGLADKIDKTGFASAIECGNLAAADSRCNPSYITTQNLGASSTGCYCARSGDDCTDHTVQAGWTIWTK